MTAHDVPLLWCFLQVTLLASLGIVAGWLLVRRAPAGGAIAAATAATTIVAVTLLAPVSLPNLPVWREQPVEQHPGESSLPQPSDDETSAAEEGPSFDALAMFERLLSAPRAVRFVEPLDGHRVESFVGTIAAAGAAIGCLRLLQSWRFVRRIRRSRTPISQGDVVQIFASVKTSLGVGRLVELCESSLIASPAVVGWRRPIVLLPIERAQWTERQLRAALAHELAHVVRNDYFWRCAGAVTLAVHFFHPLVHLLARRLALLQEIATDRLAATAFGESTRYLQALSELAIRLDEAPRFRVEPIVLPALSSNLTRRIDMLRSMEGSTGAARPRFGGMIAAGLIAVVGVGTMALRGTAEERSEVTATETTPKGLFAREAMPPALVGASDDGLIVVRLAELAERPALTPVFELVVDQMKESWSALFPGTQPPTIDLEWIEYVAAAPALTMRAKTGNTPEKQGMATIGSEELVIGLTREAPWREWVLENVRGSEEVTEEGFKFVKLPTIPALGLERFCLAARDSRTLVIAGGVDRLRKSTQGPPPAGTTRLADSWTALEGGLASALYKIELDKSTVPPDGYGAQVMVHVLENAKQIGVGFDIDPATNQSGIRLHVTCLDRESAERVRELMRGCLPIARLYFQNAIANPPQVVADDEAEREHWTMTAGTPETDRMVAQWYLDLVTSCSVKLEPRDDGMVDVRIAAHAMFPTSIHTAYEYQPADEEVERK